MVRPAPFGRASLLEEIEDVCAQVGGALLVGPPGVGKTRLLEAWATKAGATEVSLEGHETLDEVVGTLADALAVTTRGRSAARRREALLVALRQREGVALALDAVDDLEPEALALLGSLRRAGVTRVATSRVVHALDATAVVEVPPLALPEGRTSQQIRESPAVRFFVEHAERLGADLALNADDAAWQRVADVVERLDGLPLALAVTAGRVRALGIGRLADELERTDAEPEPGREHPHLGPTVATSLERLPVSSLRLLEHAVWLADGCTLEELESFVGTPANTEDLERLVQHSLVRARTGSGPPSYGSHAVVRRVVTARMSEAERSALAAAHARFMAREAEAHAHGPGGRPWIVRHERALQSTVAWAAASETADSRDLALAAAAALGRLAESRGPTDGLTAMLDEAMALLDDSVPQARRAEVTYLRGFVHAEQIEILQAQRLLRAARELAAGVHPHVEASALAQLAWIDARFGNVEDALTLRGAIDDALGAEVDPWLALLVAALDTLLEANAAHHERAREHAEAWRAFAANVGDGTHEAYAWGVLGCIALDQGDTDTALQRLDRCLELAQRFQSGISDAIFRGFRAVTLHTRGTPDAQAYADAVTRCDATGAMVYSGLFRGWQAMLRIRDGAPAEVDDGMRTLDVLRAAATWDMPRTLLALMSTHGDLAEARVADPAVRSRAFARAARRLDAPSATDLSSMIQVRLVARVLEREVPDALPEPPAEGLAVGWRGAAVFREGARHSLTNHPTLARLAWHLALERLLAPGEAQTPETLLRVGWPDDAPGARGAKHRLRVAVSTLRKSGFGDALVHADGGYRIEPGVPVELVRAG